MKVMVISYDYFGTLYGQISFLRFYIVWNSLVLSNLSIFQYYLYQVRYKYIVRPESVYEASVHFPFLMPRLISSSRAPLVHYVSESLALLHHYRDIELGMEGGHITLKIPTIKLPNVICTHIHTHIQLQIHLIAIDVKSNKTCSYMDQTIHRFRDDLKSAPLYTMLAREVCVGYIRFYCLLYSCEVIIIICATLISLTILS